MSMTFVQRLVAPLLAATFVASPLTAQDSTRVDVSRREVRVTFPRDTATRWGFADRRDPQYWPFYAWSISVHGMDGSRSLSLDAWRPDTAALWYPSLSALVASARGGVCRSSMAVIVPCPPPSVEGDVEDGRVVLVLRDSAAIDRLFGMRPATVGAGWRTPETSGGHTVHVRYADPQLPEPDSARRADAAASRRRDRARDSHVDRHIVARGGRASVAWIPLGDTLRLHVEEYRCQLDLCGGVMDSPRDSGWSVDDSLVAVVRDTRAESAKSRGFGHIVAASRQPTVGVVGRRPGRTMVRVRGIGSMLDTVPAATPPARELAVEVVVTRPVARLQVIEPVGPVPAGEQVQLRARALDVHGAEVADAPVRWVVVQGRYPIGLSGTTPRHAFADAAPAHAIVQLGALADTARIEVRARPQR